jgi:hypothetical protein
MHKLYLAADLIDAHLLLHRLQAAGIEARVLNEHAAGGVGELAPDDAAPEVWIVQERDLDRALGIVEDHEYDLDETGEDAARTLRCPHCGEENPESFEVCWSCGIPLS